ncbi:GDSL-type esterase/lipase family protein [Arthrobacter sp.]|uniref:GDSL-type esterase/lipase family protein n=1 Tax=Arthrobacter sp. TaxID=1667 RepID=UPI00281243C4|nr:GDSL-type esterase/lipase family protein [Arthrobacter sp.]
MAALGDSITRALAVCCSDGDNARHSWSTGDRTGDGVTSHYERLRGLDAAITGRNHNNALSGSRAVHLPGQAETAIQQNVEYVTILTGANDLCASSAATMTSEADFAAHINTALATLRRGLPRARIFVASIPDLYQLWKVLEGNAEAREAWARGTCPSMLSGGNTEEQRQLVVTRELAFNRILAQACSRYKNCRWDNNALYDFNFSASDVSTLDYFHPSLEGQARLAELTWRASWWGNEST